MENCLVTKLKGVVNNPDLEYLDYVKVAATLNPGYNATVSSALSVNNGEGSKILVFSGDITLSKSSTDVTIYGTPGTSFVLLIPRYTVSKIIFRDVNITWDFNAIKNIYGVKELSKGGNTNCKFTNFNIENLKKMQSLINLTILEGGITANIADFAEMPKLTNLTLNYCAGVTGDLVSIKNMPNLQKLVLNPTVVTDNNNTVEYLQNKGVNVTYKTYTPT